MSKFNPTALFAAHAAVREAGRKVEEVTAQADREVAPIAATIKDMRRDIDAAYRVGDKNRAESLKATVAQTTAFMEERRNRILRPALEAYAAAANFAARQATADAVNLDAPTPTLTEVAAAS